MAQRLYRIVSIVLSSVIVSAVSDKKQVFAQTLTGRRAPAAPTLRGVSGIAAAPGVLPAPLAASLMAPALAAPSILTPSPLASGLVAPAAALKPIGPAAALAASVDAAAPILQALQKRDVGGSAASAAGRALEDTLTGAKSAASASDAALTSVVAPGVSYALALAEVRARAVESGVSIEKIRFLSAVGARDGWRYYFGLGDDRGGIEHMAGPSGTLMTGAASSRRMRAGVPAESFDENVKISPDAALKSTQREVSRMSLLTRFGAGGKELWYSLQDERGRELSTVNARTGEARAAWTPVKTALREGLIKSLLNVAAVAGLYAGLFGMIWLLSLI